MALAIDLRSWKFLLAELMVVFLGVYGAFWVDNYRDEQDEIERTEEVVRVLLQDMADLVKVGSEINDQMDGGLRSWDEARQRGEMPAPFVFRLFGAEKPPVSSWEIVRQSQLAELIEPNLLYELGFFYSEMSGVGDRYIRYIEYAESEVLPLLNSGGAVFYDDSGDQLLSQFEASMDRLREYHLMHQYIIDWAICLRDRLATVDGFEQTCRGELGPAAF